MCERRTAENRCGGNPFRGLIEFLAQATSLVFEGAADDFGFRSQKLGNSLGGQQLWRLS